MSFRRCIIILSLFVCIACIQGRMVDCERFPFHLQCRGAQTRKRFVSMTDNDLDERGYNFKTKYPAKNNLIPDSILWTILLENSLNTDDLLDAYASSTLGRRKNASRRINRDKPRRIPERKDFLSELGSLDDY